MSFITRQKKPTSVVFSGILIFCLFVCYCSSVDARNRNDSLSYSTSNDDASNLEKLDYIEELLVTTMSSYDVSITRIGEDELMVVIDEKLVFGKDQFTLIDKTKNKVDRVITVMSKYPYFHVNIGMHAIDSNWSEPNQGLFSLRMESLNHYFKNKDIGVGRLSYHLNREQHDICSSKSLIEGCQFAKVKIYITPLLSSIY
ncbi:hypothetical protein ACPV54_08335 [Vibrio mediterranei]